MNKVPSVKRVTSACRSYNKLSLSVETDSQLMKKYDYSEVMKHYELRSFEKSNSYVFTYKIIKVIYKNMRGFVNTIYCRIYNNV